MKLTRTSFLNTITYIVLGLSVLSMIQGFRPNATTKLVEMTKDSVIKELNAVNSRDTTKTVTLTSEELLTLIDISKDYDSLKIEMPFIILIKDRCDEVQQGHVARR